MTGFCKEEKNDKFVAINQQSFPDSTHTIIRFFARVENLPAYNYIYLTLISSPDPQIGELSLYSSLQNSRLKVILLKLRQFEEGGVWVLYIYEARSDWCVAVNLG